MNDPIKDVLSTYEYFLDTKSPQIKSSEAALLTLACMIQNATKGGYLSDELCKGIRYGLFGSNAADNSSILEITD